MLIPCLLGVIAGSSFILAIIPEYTKNSSVSAIFLSFYSPFPRVWEFLVGATVALTQKYSYLLPKYISRMTQVTGLSILVCSGFFIRESTSWPNTQTILPVLGTALVIFSGNNESSRVITNRMMVWVGDRSYSIYIWHWPVVVFVGLIFSRSALILSIATGVSLIIAMMSYRFVEQYWRNWDSPSGRVNTLVIGLIIAVPLLITNSTGLITNRIIDPIYSNNASLIANIGDIGQETFNDYIQRASTTCNHNDPVINSSVINCRYSNSSDNPEIVILGDSHTEPLFLGLTEARPDIAIKYLMFNSAPAYQEQGVSDVVAKISKIKSVRKIILIARWSIRGINMESLGSTISILSNSGKTVYISDDIPGFPFDAFGCKYRRAGFLPVKCNISRKTIQQEQHAIENDLNALAQQNSGTIVLESFRYFCNSSTCTMAKNNKLFYRDENHLNIEGSLLLGNSLFKDYPQLFHFD
jgi:hypothetical protein